MASGRLRYCLPALEARSTTLPPTHPRGHGTARGRPRPRPELRRMTRFCRESHDFSAELPHYVDSKHAPRAMPLSERTRGRPAASRPVCPGPVQLAETRCAGSRVPQPAAGSPQPAAGSRQPAARSPQPDNPGISAKLLGTFALDGKKTRAERGVSTQCEGSAPGPPASRRDGPRTGHVRHFRATTPAAG